MLPTRAKLLTIGVVAEIRLGKQRQDLTATGSKRFCGMTLPGNTFRTRRPLESMVAVAGIVDGVLDDRPAREIGSQVAVAGHQRGYCQVARQVGAVGHGRDARIQALAVAVPLEVEEEEVLFLSVVEFRDPHRAAESPAVVGQVLHHFDMVSRAVIGERDAGVQDRILEVDVGAAVKLVGAALRREVINAAAADSAVLGREVRGLKRELLDRFHRRLHLVGNLGLSGASACWPSNTILKLFEPPLIEMLFQPLNMAPGVIWTNDNGFRMAPAPMPKLIGSSAICFPVIVIDCSALSVFSSVDSAVTVTDSVAEPTFNTTSTRVVTATCTCILVCSILAEARVRQLQSVRARRQRQQRVVAGSRCDGLAVGSRIHVGNDMRAPGTNAPVESETVPVIAPRSLCAKSAVIDTNSEVIRKSCLTNPPKRWMSVCHASLSQRYVVGFLSFCGRDFCKPQPGVSRDRV